MSMSRREISSVSLSMAISVAIHMIILTVVWVILLQTPEPELDLRLEVVLNPPPASQSPVTDTQSTAPEPDSAEQSPASEPAAEPQSPAPSLQPESAAAPPSRTAPAQPTPAASPRPAVPENPAPAEPDYAVQEPAAEPRRATSLGSFLDTEDTSSEPTLQRASILISPGPKMQTQLLHRAPTLPRQARIPPPTGRFKGSWPFSDSGWRASTPKVIRTPKPPVPDRQAPPLPWGKTSVRNFGAAADGSSRRIAWISASTSNRPRPNGPHRSPSCFR
jgi:hypothetical protein